VDDLEGTGAVGLCDCFEARHPLESNVAAAADAAHLDLLRHAAAAPAATII